MSDEKLAAYAYYLDIWSSVYFKKCLEKQRAGSVSGEAGKLHFKN